MPTKTISALEAIRTFYITEELLPAVIKKKDLSPKQLEKELQKIIRAAQKIPKKILISYHMDHYNLRYYNYLNATWELSEVLFEDCGVWPGMSGLPLEATYGSPLDVAQYVAKFLTDKNRLTWKTHRALYIEQLSQYAEIIAKYIPMIVLDGGVIRNTNVAILKDTKKFRRFTYDIDDGNNRAVALVLLGIKSTNALVGKRIHKSELFG